MGSSSLISLLGCLCFYPYSLSSLWFLQELEVAGIRDMNPLICMVLICYWVPRALVDDLRWLFWSWAFSWDPQGWPNQVPLMQMNVSFQLAVLHFSLMLWLQNVYFIMSPDSSRWVSWVGSKSIPGQKSLTKILYLVKWKYVRFIHSL